MIELWSHVSGITLFLPCCAGAGQHMYCPPLMWCCSCSTALVLYHMHAVPHQCCTTCRKWHGLLHITLQLCSIRVMHHVLLHINAVQHQCYVASVFCITLVHPHQCCIALHMLYHISAVQRQCSTLPVLFHICAVPHACCSTLVLYHMP